MTRSNSTFAAILGVVLFSLTFTLKTNAQNITIDTAFGGQLNAVLKGKVIVPKNDTVSVYKEWAYGSPFTTPYSTFTKTFINDSIGGNDTLTLQDTIYFSTSGKYFVRYATTKDTTSGWPVLVSKKWIAPTLSLGKKYSTSDGGVQSLTYDCGNTTAKLYVYMSPGDSYMKYRYLVKTYTLTGNGSFNHVFSGLAPQDTFSYYFEIVNVIDSTVSQTMYMVVLPSAGPAWISTIDTLNATQDSIYAHTEVITNGDTTRVVLYLKKHLSKNFTDSVVSIIPGQGGVNSIWSSIGNLKANTDYDICVCAMNKLGGKCSDTIAVSTLSIPLTLSVVVDTLYPLNGTTEHVILKVTSPDSAWVGAQLTIMSDLKFNNPIASPNLVKVGPGITYLHFDFTQLYTGQKLRVGGYAFNLTSTNIVPIDSGVPFIFGVPVPIITYLFANKTTVVSGGSVKIWCNAKNADELNLVDQTTGIITTLNPTDSIIVSPLVTTTYILYAYNYSFGGIDTQSITIQVTLPKPMITFISDKDTVEEGTPVVLSWILSNSISGELDGVAIPSTGYQIVTPPIGTTTYKIVAWNSSDTITKTKTIVVIKTTGISAIESKLLNTTYPNPSNGSITITIPVGKSSVVQIFDNSGIVVKTEQVHGGSTMIDTSGLKPGLYYFRTDFGQGTVLVN